MNRTALVSSALCASIGVACAGADNDEVQSNAPEGGVEGPDGGSPEAQPPLQPQDPDAAEIVTVDRFSPPAATLMVRDALSILPDAGEPIDFDQLTTKGLGPLGEHAEYYNLDIQGRIPNPMYVFERMDGAAVDGQLNVIDKVPGDDGYTDFWDLYRVRVPYDYEANTVTDAAHVENVAIELDRIGLIMNGPVTPPGSTASRGVLRPPTPERAWYRGQVAHYMRFEDNLVPSTTTSGEPRVPVAYIFVSFSINPGEPGGGPPSGFLTEPGTDQTHNVLQALPGESGYSPLWMVIPYDNTAFDTVMDVTSAEAAPLVQGVETPYVNCPVAAVMP